MARYSSLVGQHVDIRYRAGEVLMQATGMLAADSGRSIFLEEHLSQRQGLKRFRWEIPYSSIVEIVESAAPVESAAKPSPQD